MTGRELQEAMNYTGQERAARRLAIDSNLVKPEKAATMTCGDICDLLAKEFVMACSEGERITLVHKKDEKAYLALVKFLDR